MDKAVKRHILKKRIVLAKRSDEPMTFTERAPKFFKWFEEDVMGFDSEEYRREFWREAYRHGRTIGHIPHTLNDQLRRQGRRGEAVLLDALCISLLMGGSFAIWVIRRKIDQHLHCLRRPSYYETERARRLGLTDERRRIRRRTTVNSRPTADQLREAFLHARDSVGNMVRLGSLMEDLECYIDNSLVFGEDGRIIARKGGIRRYIQSEIPDLYKSYKTLMRYKALARKFRQAVGICDPIPAASVLPKENETADAETRANGPALKCRKVAENSENAVNKTICKGGMSVENKFRTNSQVGAEGGEALETGGSKADIGNHRGVGCVENIVRTDSQSDEDKGDDGIVDGRSGEEDVACREIANEENEHLNDEVRRVVGEILSVCEGTFLDLASVLALRICEDAIPHRSYQCCHRNVGA